jgi:hypothetical protein
MHRRYSALKGVCRPQAAQRMKGAACHRNCLFKAEFIIKVKQLFRARALGLVPAVFIECKGVLLKIVVSRDNEYPLSALFQIPQQLNEFQVAFHLAVKGKVARNQQCVRLVGGLRYSKIALLMLEVSAKHFCS